MLGFLPMSRMIEWLLAPRIEFGADPVAGRDSFALRSLRAAVRDLEGKLGPDMTAWRYGQPGYKHVVIRHPLSPAVSDDLRRRLDVGPAPRGGNSYTLNNTSGGDNQTHGASFRIVVETGAWDAAVGSNAPGQSGDPDSAHYRDLFDLWANDKYFPVFYSRERIEQVTDQVIILVPRQ